MGVSRFRQNYIRIPIEFPTRNLVLEIHKGLITGFIFDPSRSTIDVYIQNYGIEYSANARHFSLGDGKLIKIMPNISVTNALTIAIYEELFNAKLVSRTPYVPELGQKMGFSDDFDYEHSTIDSPGCDIEGADFLSRMPLAHCSRSR